MTRLVNWPEPNVPMSLMENHLPRKAKTSVQVTSRVYIFWDRPRARALVGAYDVC